MKNYEQLFNSTDRSDVLKAWGGLLAAITSKMDARRYELVTLAAARRLRSSYCSLAHGKVLLELGEPVEAIARDRGAAGLDEVDVAIMDFAERIVDDTSSIGDADRQRLRDLGLSGAEIMDVALAASARCFFAKAVDAMGVLADASFRELGPELREVLVVGRPIAGE